MTPASMTPAFLGTKVLERLHGARERVAHGWPSVLLALAGTPTNTAQARLREAEDATHASAPVPSKVLELTDALAAVEEAREVWGSAPDVMPPASSTMPPCALELRYFMPAARANATLPWEDPGGLSRPQALCVLHLACCLLEWRMAEQRQEAAAEKARAELDREAQERAQAAARVIWAPQPAKSTPKREPPPKEPRSLRELGRRHDAFAAGWSEEDEA